MKAGWGKLGDISQFSAFLESHHLFLPTFNAYLAALTELVGGLLLMLGLAARLAAIPLIITMIVAYLTVHVTSLYVFIENPSVFVAEAPFNFLLAALFVLAFGPGCFSIDWLLEKFFFSKNQADQLNK